MDCRLGVDIIVASVKGIKAAAEITKGALRPVPEVFNLHFEVDHGVVIQENIDVQKEGFSTQIFSEQNGICNGNRSDIVWGQVKYGADQAF